jgi:hypothetical protein
LKEIPKDWKQINITTIISYLKIRLILHSSLYYFFPKKSNCNYQGLQRYSSFQKGLYTISSFKFNFTFCISVLSFRHGLQVHQVASKRLKTKGWISWKGWNWTVLQVYCWSHVFKSNHYYDYYSSAFFFLDDVSRYQIMVPCIWIHSVLI